MTRERAQAGNDRTLHRRQIVTKSNRIDELAGPLVILGIERVDMTDSAAHEEENDRPGLRGMRGTEDCVLDFAGLRPYPSEGHAQKPAAELVDETATGQPSARIDL